MKSSSDSLLRFTRGFIFKNLDVEGTGTVGAGTVLLIGDNPLNNMIDEFSFEVFHGMSLMLQLYSFAC